MLMMLLETVTYFLFVLRLSDHSMNKQDHAERNDRLCGLVVRVPGYTDPEVRVRCPVLPDFLRSNASGTGFTHPREYN
jgi:hypothetical protein